MGIMKLITEYFSEKQTETARVFTTQEANEALRVVEKMGLIPEAGIRTGYEFPEAVIAMTRQADRDLKPLFASKGVDQDSYDVLDVYVRQIEMLGESCLNDQQEENEKVNHLIALTGQVNMKTAEQKLLRCNMMIEKLEAELKNLEMEDA